MKAGNRKVTRHEIIQTLTETLKPTEFVHAFWEGGAAAFDRVDAWSDIDLYVLVDDEKVDEAFTLVEQALISLSPIKQKYDVPWPPDQGISQAFYRLRDASEYLLIDLAIMKPSAPEKYLEPRIHGDAVFYINNAESAGLPAWDGAALGKKLDARFKRLQARFELFNIFIQKEINRGNLLEALDLYFNLTLVSLVEALRIKHYPLHYDFKMRYIYRELPVQEVKRLEELYLVRNIADLQEKYERATEWFLATASEIKPEKVRL